MSGPTSKNATLSSIQSAQAQRHMASASSDAGSGTLDTPGQYVYYASFPVDVMVFFHFQPTIIRLGCLPVSRVECLLHLPSIDLVMSSKRSEFEPDLPSTSDSPSTPQMQMPLKSFRNMSKSVGYLICSFIREWVLISFVLAFFRLERRRRLWCGHRWRTEHHRLLGRLFTVHLSPVRWTEEQGLTGGQVVVVRAVQAKCLHLLHIRSKGLA